MTYSSSPTTIGDGVNGAPRVVDHAMCVSVTSPVPVRTDGQHRGLEEAGGDVDEPVREHRARDVREPVLVAHHPDFPAGCRIVGRCAIRADADDLIAAVDRDHERRRVRLIERLAPLGLPLHVARALVERDDPRFVVAVAAENQQIAVERRQIRRRRAATRTETSSSRRSRRTRRRAPRCRRRRSARTRDRLR